MAQKKGGCSSVADGVFKLLAVDNAGDRNGVSSLHRINAVELLLDRGVDLERPRVK